MAKVTVELEDLVKDGKPVVSVKFNVDREDVGDNEPATDAMMHGLCIARLWQCRSLANMMPHVCADALMQRAELTRQLAMEAGKPVEVPTGMPGPSAPSANDFEKMAVKQPA